MTLPPKAIILGVGGSFSTGSSKFWGCCKFADAPDDQWSGPAWQMGLSSYLQYAWIADEEPVLSTQPEPESGEIPLEDLVVAKNGHECSQDAPERVEAPFAETNPADPYGIPQHAPGAKNDEGKIMASLILGFPRALWAIGAVATYGARKYTRDGWSHVPEAEARYEDAEIRHLLMGAMEENDQESGLPHAWHHAWNVLATLELQLRKQEEKKPE
jgi:hypothetical protein